MKEWQKHILNAKIAKILRTFTKTFWISYFNANMQISQCQHNFAFERQLWITQEKIINEQFFQPKLLLESSIIIYKERKTFNFLASLDTDTLS